MKRNKIKFNKYFLIIIIIIIIFIGISLFFNYFLFYEKYEVNLNLSFNLKTKVSWDNISSRYENIINMYDSKDKKIYLVKESLNNKFNTKKVVTKLIFDSDVYARQVNIKYISESKETGIEIVNDIGNAIIKRDKTFMPKENVQIEKNITINTENIEFNKKLNILIFMIWGLALGIGISMIMEAKCILKKK